MTLEEKYQYLVEFVKELANKKVSTHSMQLLVDGTRKFLVRNPNANIANQILYIVEELPTPNPEKTWDNDEDYRCLNCHGAAFAKEKTCSHNCNVTWQRRQSGEIGDSFE